MDDMTCPECGVRNYSVTFLAAGGRIFHDCGHETESGSVADVFAGRA